LYNKVLVCFGSQHFWLIILPPKKISTKSSPVNQNTELLGQEVQFVHLFNQDKNRLYAYIYALVTERAAADDIFQETCIALWKDFHKFEIGTSFSKWANGIAFNRVYEFRWKKLTQRFSNQFQK
jgi:DNA-directed RNA polymerase specialized sigma24 family protein